MSRNTDALIERLTQRERRGIETYGVTLDRNDISELTLIDDAIDEALDLAAYLQRLKTKLKERPDRPEQGY